MVFEIGAPSVLTFGVVRLENKTCLLGITLQHPPVHLTAKEFTGYQISGARSDIGHDFAARFFAHHQLEQEAEIEIELAIPASVGLGSEIVLGLSAAQALSNIHGLADDKADPLVLAKSLDLIPQNALELWAFDQGGLLLVETEAAPGEMPAILRRREIQHATKEDWAFVLHFPRIPKEAPRTIETQRLENLLAVAPNLGSDAEKCGEDLWSAVVHDDLETFAEGLDTLSRLNNQALEDSDASIPFTAEEQAILDIMRQNGALTCGRSATGYGLYALVRGSAATVSLRHALRDHVGHFGGIAAATITDNQGARVIVKD